MREVVKTVKVFKLEELSKKAQEKAFSNWCATNDYPYSDENEKTLKAFVHIFPVSLLNWQYDDSTGFVRYDFTDADIEDMWGIRLMRYLWNNYFDDLYQGKYFSTTKYEDGKPVTKSRRSKVIFTVDCPLTGYYMDYDIIKPLLDYMHKPDHRSFNDLMNDCFSSWVNACVRDMDGYYSVETFEEEVEANDWEFLEDGTMY